MIRHSNFNRARGPKKSKHASINQVDEDYKKDDSEMTKSLASLQTTRSQEITNTANTIKSGDFEVIGYFKKAQKRSYSLYENGIAWKKNNKSKMKIQIQTKEIKMINSYQKRRQLGLEVFTHSSQRIFVFESEEQKTEWLAELRKLTTRVKCYVRNVITCKEIYFAEKTKNPIKSGVVITEHCIYVISKVFYRDFLDLSTVSPDVFLRKAKKMIVKIIVLENLQIHIKESHKNKEKSVLQIITTSADMIKLGGLLEEITELKEVIANQMTSNKNKGLTQKHKNLKNKMREISSRSFNKKYSPILLDLIDPEKYFDDVTNRSKKINSVLAGSSVKLHEITSQSSLGKLNQSNSESTILPPPPPPNTKTNRQNKPETGKPKFPAKSSEYSEDPSSSEKSDFRKSRELVKKVDFRKSQKMSQNTFFNKSLSKSGSVKFKRTQTIKQNPYMRNSESFPQNPPEIPKVRKSAQNPPEIPKVRKSAQKPPEIPKAKTYNEVIEWSPEEVTDWMSSISRKFEAYRETFIELGVDGEMLLVLLSKDLLREAISNPMLVSILWKKIEELRQSLE